MLRFRGGRLMIPFSLTRVSTPRARYVFLCAQQVNEIDIWPTHKKLLLPYPDSCRGFDPPAFLPAPALDFERRPWLTRFFNARNLS